MCSGKGLTRKNRFLKREKMLSPIFRLLFATGQPSIERAYSPPHNLVAVAIAATSTVLDAAASAAFFCIFISLFTYVRAFADIFYVLVADLQKIAPST